MHLYEYNFLCNYKHERIHLQFNYYLIIDLNYLTHISREQYLGYSFGVELYNILKYPPSIKSSKKKR